MLSDIVANERLEVVANSLKSEVLPAQPEQFNALVAAVERGESQILEAVLDFGADPNYFPDEGWPVLHSAVEFSRVDLVMLLVKKGANINMQDQSGATPLHVAVDLEGDAAWQSGEPPKTTLTKLLLDLGADPQIANKEGKTPADVAREYNHLGALSMLGR